MTNYIINPIYFYLANIADTVGSILLLFSLIAIALIGLICVFWGLDNAVDIFNMDDDEKATFKKFKKFMAISLIFLSIGIAIPSKRTCIEMLIASNVTYENVSETKEEVYEFVDYVVDKLDTSDEE